MQTFEAKRYDLAEKTFKRAIQGNYAPAKAKLLETQTLLNPASVQNAPVQSTDPKEIKILEQVHAQQNKINDAQTHFRGAHNEQISLADTEYKEQSVAKQGLRTEIEGILKLHKDLVAMVPAVTSNTEMLKIRQDAPRFKEYYEKLYKSFSTETTNSNDADILKKVLVYQTKIEAASNQSIASAEALKKLPEKDWKAKVETKQRLRTELEVAIKLHNDQLALIPSNTTNPDLLKIRNSTTMFKSAFEKLYQTVRPYKIGQDSFLYDLDVVEQKALVIRRRMNTAKKAGDSSAWLADQPKYKASLNEQIAICSLWLNNLAQYNDPEWPREKLNIEEALPQPPKFNAHNELVT